MPRGIAACRWLIGAAMLHAASVCAQSEVPVATSASRITAPVASFLEIRDRNLVRQGWDISCGAAALSTVLTYHFGTPYSERTIALSILANTDPALVRARGGFSLLDLKRFAEAVGYSAIGYGGLTLDDLSSQAAPVIVPVRIRELDHFVVFRGLAADKVLIGDPAFGNLTLSRSEFMRIWTSAIGFVVEPEGSDGGRMAELGPEAAVLSIPDLNFVYRLTRQGSMTPATRRPAHFGPPSIP